MYSRVSACIIYEIRSSGRKAILLAHNSLKGILSIAISAKRGEVLCCREGGVSFLGRVLWWGVVQ